MRYMLCALPRSGSGYLCELLEATGVAGKPREYIGDYRPSTHQAWHAFEAEVSSGGVLGWKAMFWSLEHLDEFERNEGKTRAELLRELFGTKFIYLTRRNKVDQAISYLRYQRDGRASSLDAPHPLTEYTYSDAWLDFMLTTLCVVETAWEDLFSEMEIEPLRISYEEFSTVERRENLIQRVLGFLEIPAPNPLFSKEIERGVIRDKLNADWRDRYLEHFPFQTYERWIEFINTFHRQPRKHGDGAYYV